MTPERLPPVDKDIMARAMTLAERSAWESDPTKADAQREAALQLWAEAHQARREAMYLRGRR
jgi:hypothetical protein